MKKTRRVNEKESSTAINLQKKKLQSTKRTTRCCLKLNLNQALSSSAEFTDASDSEENISDWKSENNDTELDDSTNSEESAVDEIEDYPVTNNDTEEDVNNPVREGATPSILAIDKICNAPSCNSFLPPNVTLFQLPTTKKPVCSGCYKKYLETEFNIVDAIEEKTILAQTSLYEDLPEIGLEDLTTFFEVVHQEEDCFTILKDLEKSSKEFLLRKAIDEIFPPLTSKFVIWTDIDIFPVYRLYTWTEHETVPLATFSNFLPSFIEDLSKIFPELRISEDSFDHPDFIDDLPSEPSCSTQMKSCSANNEECDVDSEKEQELEYPNVYNQPDCYLPFGYNNETQEFYNSQELDCYQPFIYNNEANWNLEFFVPQFPSNPSHTLHCYEPPQEDESSTETITYTTLEPVSSISSSKNPDIQANCYRPLQENVPIIYSSESIPFSLEEQITEDSGVICEVLNSDSSPEKAPNSSNLCSQESQESGNESIQKLPNEKGRKRELIEGQHCANTFCKVALLKNIRVHPVTNEKVCRICYNYYKTNGRDREVIITKRRREKHETNCANTFCKRSLLSKKFSVHPVTKGKICDACYTYYKRNGKDREVINIVRRREKHETNCANSFCKKILITGKYNVHPVTKEKICHTCYSYHKVNGKDREVIKTIRRREKHETNCANTFCNVELLKKNKLHPVTKKKVCSICYTYYKRNGRDREVIITKRKREKHETNCANTFCKQALHSRNINVHPVTKEKICSACGAYYKRNGKDRTIVHKKREEHETICANTFCRQPLLPGKYRPHPVTKEKICKVCYYFHKRNGEDRKVIKEKAEERPEKHHSTRKRAFKPKPKQPTSSSDSEENDDMDLDSDSGSDYSTTSEESAVDEIEDASYEKKRNKCLKI